MTPELHAYLRRQPGRCQACVAHIDTQGHNDDCPLKGKAH